MRMLNFCLFCMCARIFQIVPLGQKTSKLNFLCELQCFTKNNPRTKSKPEYKDSWDLLGFTVGDERNTSGQVHPDTTTHSNRDVFSPIASRKYITDSFRLQISGVFQAFQQRKKEGGVRVKKKTEPQLFKISTGSPGNLTNKRKENKVWMLAIGQQLHKYVCRLRRFSKRGGTTSFQPLKEKQTPPPEGRRSSASAHFVIYSPQGYLDFLSEQERLLIMSFKEWRT